MIKREPLPLFVDVAGIIADDLKKRVRIWFTATLGALASQPIEARNPDLCTFFVAVGILLTRGEIRAHNGKVIRRGRPRIKVYG